MRCSSFLYTFRKQKQTIFYWMMTQKHNNDFEKALHIQADFGTVDSLSHTENLSQK